MFSATWRGLAELPPCHLKFRAAQDCSAVLLESQNTTATQFRKTGDTVPAIHHIVDTR
jgi:hypothetical protein